MSSWIFNWSSRVIMWIGGTSMAWRPYLCYPLSKPGACLLPLFYPVPRLINLLFLLARYPDKITFLRGNHENRDLCKTYGFYGLSRPHCAAPYTLKEPTVQTNSSKNTAAPLCGKHAVSVIHLTSIPPQHPLSPFAN